MDENFKDQLIAAYDADASRRADDTKKRSEWKREARQQFANFARSKNKKSILEIGAGAGLDSKFFQDQGFEVLATDLSPKMADECKKLGLSAKAIDLYDLEQLGRKFDAIYSLNVLLHVPPQDLVQVLSTISNCLRPDGLFFYGVYGGIHKENTFTDPNQMNMPRYFSFLDDQTMVKTASTVFDVVKTETIDIGDDPLGLHFQSLLLRKK
jgi:cyclopropane fatty-acyl-phospholipid synthase-like methyltransferase